MIKKIAYVFTLAVFMASATFAQDKAQVASSDVVLMVKLAKADESNAKIISGLKHSKLAKSESNSVFYLTTSKDVSESAVKELKGTLSGVEMKVARMTGEEFLKEHKGK